MYYVILQNYDSIKFIKTKEYNDDVKHILQWFYTYYDVVAYFREGDSEIYKKYCVDTKDFISEELKWRREFYYYDEDEVDIEKKEKSLLEVLV